MPLDEQESIKIAIKDLSQRLQVEEADIKLENSASAEFTNACLDAAKPGEMCAQMMMKGWRLQLSCRREPGKQFEYRAAKNQLRLYGFNGQNYKVYP